MLVDGGGVMVDAARLPRREITDGGGKALVGDVMRGARHGRHEAAGYLVLALRAGLEACESVLDAVFDALVVAGLEMQAVVVAAGAPVAAVQRILAHEEDRERDRRPALAGDLQHHSLRHPLAHHLEELQIEVGLVAVPIEGIGIELVHRPPQRIVHLAAQASIEFDARLRTRRRSRFAFLRFSAVKVARKSSKDS